MRGSEQVPLSAFLTPTTDEVVLQPDTTYRTAGIYSFGKGLFERESILGAETFYTTLFRVRENQFVVSKLNGWEGAVDVVSPELDGCHVSSEYPAFTIDAERADPRYIRWIARWPAFWDKLIPRGSMVRRKRVQPKQLLDVRVPLPQLDEQGRIAARLDRARAALDRMTQLSERSDQLSGAFAAACASAPHLSANEKSARGWSRVHLREVLARSGEQTIVDPTGSYANVGIYSFGRGLFQKPPIEGDATSARTLFPIRAGQFIYSRLFAFEGAYATVPEIFDGYFVSNEFPSFDAVADRLEAAWLASYLRSPDRWADLAATSIGLGVRRQRVPVDAVFAHEVLLPPIDEQRAMVRSIQRVEATRTLRRRSATHVAATVPSLLNQEFGART